MCQVHHDANAKAFPKALLIRPENCSHIKLVSFGCLATTLKCSGLKQ